MDFAIEPSSPSSVEQDVARLRRTQTEGRHAEALREAEALLARLRSLD